MSVIPQKSLDERTKSVGVSGLPDHPALSTTENHRTFQPHFMLVPSLACPAECSYCFGPHAGPTMSAETMDAALDLMARIADETNQQKVVRVTFHGGEPLMAGHAIWRRALEGLEARFGQRQCELAVQSNLWLLDDEFCRLFRRAPGRDRHQP